jgi:hypothetical protein
MPLTAEPRRAPPPAFPDYEDEPPRDWRALAAWAASLLLLVALVAVAVQFRAEIMRAWPPSQRLYGIFGATLP